MVVRRQWTSSEVVMVVCLSNVGSVVVQVPALDERVAPPSCVAELRRVVVGRHPQA